MEIYKINDNASVEDSNFLEDVKGEPKFNKLINRFDWDELPPLEGGAEDASRMKEV